MFERVITHDEAEWKILRLANDKGKFAIEMGLNPNRHQQEAFERGIDNDWFTLVDVGPIVHAPGKVMRIFKLTTAGKVRRNELRTAFGCIDEQASKVD